LPDAAIDSYFGNGFEDIDPTTQSWNNTPTEVTTEVEHEAAVNLKRLSTVTRRLFDPIVAPVKQPRFFNADNINMEFEEFRKDMKRKLDDVMTGLQTSRRIADKGLKNGKLFKSDLYTIDNTSAELTYDCMNIVQKLDEYKIN
jgi:hypothetical protein